MGVEETILEYGFVCFARIGSVQLTLSSSHSLSKPFCRSFPMSSNIFHFVFNWSSSLVSFCNFYFFLFICLLIGVFETVSHNVNSDCLEANYVYHASLELKRYLPASASHILILRVCAHYTWLILCVHRVFLSYSLFEKCQYIYFVWKRFINYSIKMSSC